MSELSVQIDRDYVIVLGRRLNRPDNVTATDWLERWDAFDDPERFWQKVYDEGYQEAKEKYRYG